MSLLREQSVSTKGRIMETVWNKNFILPVSTWGIVAGKIIVKKMWKKNLSSSILIVVWISLSNDLVDVHTFLVGVEITGIAFWIFIILCLSNSIQFDWCFLTGIRNLTKNSLQAWSCEDCGLESKTEVRQRIWVTVLDDCSGHQLIYDNCACSALLVKNCVLHMSCWPHFNLILSLMEKALPYKVGDLGEEKPDHLLFVVT